MSHEERPNFLKILEDIKSGSINTSASVKSDLKNKSQEELIETIRQNAAELYSRGLLIDEMSFHDYQLPVIKSLEEWMTKNSKPLPDVFLFGDFCGDSIPTPSLSKEEESIKAIKYLWGSMKETINNYVNPIMQEINTQTRIEELEKILRKHPNRSDVRMELMKLKKTVKPKIGRKKKAK